VIGLISVDILFFFFLYKMDSQVLVGPPRLLDFSCQVCSKAPATDPGNTTTSCLLQLKVSMSCNCVTHIYNMYILHVKYMVILLIHV
jgi:hypothetical protein